jgi:hypothetical protein
LGVGKLAAAGLVAILAACTSIPDPAPRGTAYKSDVVPVETLFRKVGIRQTDVVADLAWEDGSGAITAAKLGMKSRAYPDDILSYTRVQKYAIHAGVGDRMSVSNDLFRGGLSLRDANVVFYAPSPLFSWDDLRIAIERSTVRSGKIFTTNLIPTNAVRLQYVGTLENLHVYRWGQEDQPPVRDTVPPPTTTPKPSGIYFPPREVELPRPK